MTTAAGIWLTAAIGTAAGLGLETTAVLSAVLVFAVLGAMPLLQRVLTRRTARRQIAANSLQRRRSASHCICTSALAIPTLCAYPAPWPNH